MHKPSLTPAQRERSIYRVTLLGSLVNLVLLVGKFAAGLLGHSAAMLADAVHSLSDFITDVVVLLFVRLSDKPCDEDHDFGHGKYETLATAIIGLMLGVVGLGIFYDGAQSVWRWLAGDVLPRPGSIALYAAAASIVLKEGLYHYTATQARSLGSKAMLANAWHHRSDALSSIGTLVGIGGAIVLGESWRVLDPLAAIVVSILIIRVAVQIFIPCMEELLEKSLPRDDEDFIIRTIEEQPGASEPHNLRTRHIGNYCAIDVHFRMDGRTSLYDAHLATREIEDRLRQRFGPRTFINTHVEPLKHPTQTTAQQPSEAPNQA